MNIRAAAMKWLILAELLIGHATFVSAEDSDFRKICILV